MMTYYQQLARMGAFSLEDASKIMLNPENASKQLNAMVKAGVVNRIKKNLYTCVDLVAGGNVADKYVVATHINDSSFVSYHSAFEFYGFYNQVFYDVHVSSKKRFANFETDENYYRCFLTEYDEQVDTIRGVKVTSIERTIIDSVNMLGKVMDVEELVKCLQLVHVVNEEKLIDILRAYNKEILYRKAGYILSFFSEQFGLKDSFFEFCREHADFTYRGKISGTELNKLTYVKEWALYAYPNIFEIVGKGGMEDV